MGSRRAVVVLTVAALAFAGCGDDGDNESDEPTQTVDTQTAIQQDAQAKADAREMAAYVETCFVDVQDYTQCTDPAGAEKLNATVEAPSASHFVVTAVSESGNEFEIANGKDGGLVRNCTEPGVGGCNEDGTW